MAGKMDPGSGGQRAPGAADGDGAPGSDADRDWASVERCARLALAAWTLQGLRELELRLEEDSFRRAWQTRLLPSGELHVLSRVAADEAAYRLEWQFSPEGLRTCALENFGWRDRDLWELGSDPAATAVAG